MMFIYGYVLDVLFFTRSNIAFTDQNFNKEVRLTDLLFTWRRSLSGHPLSP